MTELPERYTTGVWYDDEHDEFCRITETADSVGLYRPDGNPDSPYFTFEESGLSMEETLDELAGFIQVYGEDVVGNSVDMMNELVRLDNGVGRLTPCEQLRLRYLRQYEVADPQSGLQVEDEGEYLNIKYQGVLTVSISVEHDEILLYTEGVDEPVVKRALSDPYIHR
jgi:hypothetical protein